MPNWMIGIVATDEALLGTVYRINERNEWVGLLCVILAILLGLHFLMQIARPMEVLAKEATAWGIAKAQKSGSAILALPQPGAQSSGEVRLLPVSAVTRR